MKKCRVIAIVAATVLSGGLLTGGAIAIAQPTPEPKINGCVSKFSGVLRVIDPAKGQRCNAFETPLSWNQNGQPGPIGPAGPQVRLDRQVLLVPRAQQVSQDRRDRPVPPGTGGGGGLSGYEMVQQEYPGRGLPLDNFFPATCPGTKVPLGGGARILIFADNGELVRHGSPTYAVPDGNRWVARVDQGPVAGATRADITVYVTCAEPSP